MPASDPQTAAAPRPTVFLSYASEDRRAAQQIRDALPGFGLEVWYDESDLVGGDAWDQKIRRQIRECDYFMPVISAHTEARHEGYFRREWRLAVERTLDMADDHVFLLPVVIDNTTDAGARVPDRFRAVQWLRLPDGQPTAGLEALCRRLVSGGGSPKTVGLESPRAARAPGARPEAKPRGAAAPHQQLPPFPREEPGQRLRFGLQVTGWTFQWAWAAFQRLPKWVRICAYVWFAIFLLSRWSTSVRPDVASDTQPAPGLSAAQAQKLREISGTHLGSWTPADTAKLIAQIAQEVPDQTGAGPAAHPAVLAIPFSAPTNDAAAEKLAGSVFSQLYGRLAIARHGQVGLLNQPLGALDPAAVLQQGRARQSQYIVEGAVGGSAPDQQLTIKVIEVGDGSVAWSRSYPVRGADAAGIATEVSAKVPQGDDDD